MNMKLRIALALSAATLCTQAAAQVVFYEHDGFQGRSFSSSERIRDFERAGFNDRASSAVVVSGRWEVCEHARFDGQCVVLRPGRYPSLSAMGMNDRVSSVRSINADARLDDNRYAPQPLPVYDNRRRRNERVYDADVTSVRAVVGPPQQRCWVEQEHVSQRSGANVPGAVVGAILGGVLGHQVGGGRGNDVATAGGAVIGGVVGSNVGRDERSGQTRDVKRCETTASTAAPEFFDVTYTFRGREHHIQTTTPPGRTVRVNDQGEPRA